MKLFTLISFFASSYALNVETAEIPGSKFMFGSSLHKDGGNPAPKIKSVRSFLIDKTLVSNIQFQDFASKTNYKTDSEQFEWSFVLEQLLDEATLSVADGATGMGRVKDALHWVAVVSASWMHPEGPNSDILTRPDYPVTHISCNDAKAYCKHAGGRLLTEAEFELAARAGTTSVPYYWGSSLLGGSQSDQHMCNTWQGKFPAQNLELDGYLGPSPITAFPPNNFGLHDMIGNLWQWSVTSRNECVLRGGSFIDSLTGEFNHAATVSSRQESSQDSAAINTGFRCAYSLPVPVKGASNDKDGL